MEELQIQIEELKKENQELKARLRQYTNPERYKKYYESHKTDILENKRKVREVRSKQKNIFHTYEYTTMEQLTRDISNLNNFVNNDLAKSYGLTINKITWEDVSRTKGSCWGPNISDLTLTVNDISMNMIRKPNFSDITCDLPCETFTVTVNVNGTLSRISLKEYIKNLQLYNEIDGTFNNDLFIERDNNLLVSAQCCMLPLGPEGEVEFCPKMYNYQNAVLVITSTSQGTSSTILSGKESLYFNRNGRKVKYLAKRLEQDRKERGVALEGKMTTEEEDRNAIVIYQIPLKSTQQTCDFFGSNNFILCSGISLGSDSFGEYGSCSNVSSNAFFVGGNPSTMRPKKKVKGVDNAMLRVSDKDLGEFLKLDASKLVRDDRFPIRVTYQFYKVTDTPNLQESDFNYISDKINSIYKKDGSSLVLNKTDRLTESVFPELKVPNGAQRLFNF